MKTPFIILLSIVMLVCCNQAYAEADNDPESLRAEQYRNEAARYETSAVVDESLYASPDSNQELAANTVESMAPEQDGTTKPIRVITYPNGAVLVTNTPCAHCPF